MGELMRQLQWLVERILRSESSTVKEESLSMIQKGLNRLVVLKKPKEP
jgi:hypothetical protein